MRTNTNNSYIRATTKKSVGGFTFALYIIFVISFFLHLAARIPGIAVIRPDLLLAALISIMLFMESSKLKGRMNHKCGRLFLIFIGYLIITLPFVEWPGSVLRENFADFIKAAVFFIFTVLIIDSDKRLRFFILVFIWCQLVRVFEPLFLHITTGYWGSGTHLGGGQFANRLSGAPHDIINPNQLGFVIATVFPFVHYLWGEAKWKRKIIYFSTAPPLLYALILTASRSAFIAMLVIAWNIFAKSRHKILLILALVFIALFSWTQMSDFQKDRYKSLTGDDSTLSAATFQGRINGILRDFSVSLNRPIVGHGVGTSKEALYHARGVGQLSHILYAEVLIETGFIGFIIFMLFLKAIYDLLRMIQDTIANYDTESRYYSYNNRLLKTLNTCFWMYLVFSIAQYGLSEYHWYFLGGISSVFYMLLINDNKDNAYQK